MIKSLKYFLFFAVLLLLSSCAGQTNVIKSLQNVKKSVLKIETWAKIQGCDIEACIDYSLLSTGTGTVVLHAHDKVILTAAHICAQNKYKMLEGPPLDYRFKAIDRNNKEYIVEILKYDVRADICLLRSISGDLEPSFVRMSSKTPEYGELHYNLAAPVGVIDGEMVPVYQGRFFGKSEGKAFYGMPAIGGSSGSPIVNLKGELVGMVHSVHYRFHHITLSATYDRLWNFLNIEQIRIIEVRN